MNFKEEIFKSIQAMVDKAITNCKVDRTYKTVVKRVVKKGYVILDETGCERTVRCCIPNVELRAGQAVYVKMMKGQLKDMHICGVA